MQHEAVFVERIAGRRAGQLRISCRLDVQGPKRKLPPAPTLPCARFEGPTKARRDHLRMSQGAVFAKVFVGLTAGRRRGALRSKRHGLAPSWGPGCRLWGRRPEGSLMEQGQVDAKDFFLA